MVQFGYHFAETIDHFFLEVKSNDYWEMGLHHIVTTSLIFCMIFSNFVPIGCLILFLHDISDIGPMACKMLSATEYETPTVVIFVSSLPVWFYTRNMVLTYFVYMIWTEVHYD